MMELIPSAIFTFFTVTIMLGALEVFMAYRTIMRWTKWFAWYPVGVGLSFDSKGNRIREADELAWFCWVERRMIYCGRGNVIAEVMQYRRLLKGSKQ